MKNRRRKRNQSHHQKNLQCFYDNLESFAHLSYDESVSPNQVETDILTYPEYQNIAIYTPPGVSEKTVSKITSLIHTHAGEKRQIAFLRNIDGGVIDLSSIPEYPQ